MKRLLLGLLVLAACSKKNQYTGAFDEPSAVAATQPEVGGPIEEPVGFVANLHGGRISVLALKQGRFLTDDPHASFVRGDPIPTGRDRLVGSLATFVPDDERLTLFAADRAFGHLLEIPYIVDVDDDGFPVEYPLGVTDPVFVDADDSGDSAELTEFYVANGFVASEDWSVSYDGERWWVSGSRSGPQEVRPEFDLPWRGDDGAIAFTITGSASAGDRFEFTTTTGSIEHPAGGVPLYLAMAPDQSRLAAVVQDEVRGQPVVRWFDPHTGAFGNDVELPDDAFPDRLAWAPDGSALFVADRNRPSAWEIAPGDTVALEHPLPFPIFDLAPLFEDGRRELYVAPVEGSSVWRYDLEDQAILDLNAWLEGDQGMQFNTPVMGLEAIPVPFRWLQEDEDGVRLYGSAVAVSLYAGMVEFMGGESGCALTDLLGPRSISNVNFGSLVDYERVNFDSVPNAAVLDPNGGNTHHVVVNNCAGLAREEGWTLTFDRNLVGWRVEGIRSGVQANLAYEDQRYVSDDGSISFTVRAGATPSRDGWQIRFSVDDGILAASGDNNHDGQITDLEVRVDMPGHPAFFHYEVGPDDDGWQDVDDRPFVLVAAQGSDVAGRINPSNGKVEVVWR